MYDLVMHQPIVTMGPGMENVSGFYFCIVPGVPGFYFLGENSGDYSCAR